MRKITAFVLFILIFSFSQAQAQAQAQDQDQAQSLLDKTILSSQGNMMIQADITRIKKTAKNILKQQQDVIKSIENTNKPKVVSQNDISTTRASIEQNQLATSLLIAQAQATDKVIHQNNQECQSIASDLQKLANPLTNNTDDNHTENQLMICKQQSELLKDKREAQLQLQKNYELLDKALKEKYQRLNNYYLEASATTVNEDKNIQIVENLKKQKNQIINNSNMQNIDRESRLNNMISLVFLNRQINLENLRNTYTNIDNRTQELQFADFANVSLNTLKKVQSEVSLLKNQLQLIFNQNKSDYDYIQQRYTLYSQQTTHIPDSVKQYQLNYENTQQAFSKRLEGAQQILNIIQNNISQQYTVQSQQYYKQRVNFTDEWNKLPLLSSHFSQAISTFAGQYLVAFQSTWHNLIQQSLPNIIFLFLMILTVMLGIVWIIFISNHKVQKYTQSKRLLFTSKLLLFFFMMVKKNIAYIGLFIVITCVIYLLNISSPSMHLLMLIPIIVLLISIPYSATKVLIDSEILETTYNFSISRPIIILTVINALLLAFVLLAQWLLDDNLMIDMFRWLYGLFILSLVIPLWKTINKIKKFLNNFYSDFHTYRILRLISGIIPYACAIFAIASFFGFLNFAWLFSEYAIIAFCYSLTWIMFLGILKDISLSLKRYVLVNAVNSVFWAQDIINPIHTILRYMSFVALIICLMSTYHWSAQTPMVSHLLQILQTPILQSDSNNPITVAHLLVLALVLYIIIRLGSWMKSVAYRFIFSKIIDTGIRNSLSVFSQYTIVTLGFLIALRVIGINFTAFTIFAGALGVGIGFGLQTIANNFISGLLLLIERPLRNGDTISVGNYTGIVERIGMRSLTITTFDNENVILPNSDFVTSAFKNWSHQDEIVRVICYLDIGYQHHPSKVEHVLKNGLSELADADLIAVQLPDLYSAVYAYNYSERGITYRIQFYVDMGKHDYMRSRHYVINKIWEICDQEKFELPYPKRGIIFEENPNNKPGSSLLPFPIK